MLFPNLKKTRAGCGTAARRAICCSLGDCRVSKHLGVLFAPLILGVFFISGCGGGGGSAGGAGGGVTPPGPTPCPSGYTGAPPNCVAPTTTTASGKLVDDPSGAPLGGIKVGLAPWTAAATPMPEGTTAPDGSFSFTAPNGHYLLVIGSDSVTDTTRPTIHDNVTLTGGTQVLKGPNLPTIPTVTPAPVETSGDYRMVALDTNNEVPCLQDFNAKRVSLSLGQTVEDEWLAENIRALTQAKTTSGFVGGGSFLTLGNNQIGGGATCHDMNVTSFSGAPSYAASSQTLWYAGEYEMYTPPGASTQGVGFSEFPQDPRAFSDPIGPWV